MTFWTKNKLFGSRHLSLEYSSFLGSIFSALSWNISHLFSLYFLLWRLYLLYHNQIADINVSMWFFNFGTRFSVGGSDIEPNRVLLNNVIYTDIHLAEKIIGNH